MHLSGQTDLLVLALPRGGVPVAMAVAEALKAPLDVFIVRKIGVPGHEELAMGAIASGGTVVVNRDVLAMLRIPQGDFDAEVTRQRAELKRRELLYRGSRPPVCVEGKVCIVVDDGIATGASMLAAIQALRMRNPKRIIAAAPVAASGIEHQFAHAPDEVAPDEVVVVESPEEFVAVGSWYENFPQLTDQQVQIMLHTAVSGV